MSFVFRCVRCGFRDSVTKERWVLFGVWAFAWWEPKSVVGRCPRCGCEVEWEEGVVREVPSGCLVVLDEDFASAEGWVMGVDFAMGGARLSKSCSVCGTGKDRCLVKEGGKDWDRLGEDSRTCGRWCPAHAMAVREEEVVG